MSHQLRTILRHVGGARARSAIVSLALLVVTAGASPAQTREQPAACTDSTYVALKRQNPDSLSERAWQRLQRLERDCVAARTEFNRSRHGMMGGDNHHGTWLMSAVITVMMVAMVFRHW